MFVVLDTNHYDELANDSVCGRKAQRRIESHQADVFISVVSVQESVSSASPGDPIVLRILN